MAAYDLHILRREDWYQLRQENLAIVIDPLVFRIGQFFLEGKSAAGGDASPRWRSIEGDIGALVSFFDLMVLHDRLPAFNYGETFDRNPEFGDRLGAVLNAGGDQTVVHVDVEHQMYREAKEAALFQLEERLQEEAELVPGPAMNDILTTLKDVQYEWEPSLEVLEPRIQDPENQRIARFLLGQLVFAGYAQQTGAPHVLSPRRSLLTTAAGLRAPTAGEHAEAVVFAELARRVREGGSGWRNEELPWTPSFLPFLLKRMDRYREGPDVLLEMAKELRSTPAVWKYRSLRQALYSPDAERSEDARRELHAAADEVAKSLDSSREELETVRHVAVDILPQAFGAAGGALIGAMVAGPPGAVGGSLAGLVVEHAIRPVHNRLWGWVLDQLPFQSARKLLMRSVRAEQELRQQLAAQMRTVWESARRQP